MQAVVMSVPGDKSLSHRALMLAALGTGTSELRGVLPSADVRSTAGVLASLGIDVVTDWSLSDTIRIRGVGLRGLRLPPTALDCGNSGTTTRLMAGIVAGQHLTATFVGDASLSRRPMRRIARPLTQMGASFAFESDDGLPMTVQGGDLRGIDWISPTSSAQVKSAILLAALVSGQEARVSEPVRSRDHTERMLRARGASLTVTADSVTVHPVSQLAPNSFTVPGDPSSAIFMIAAAALHGVSIELTSVGINPTRIGAFAALERMGITIQQMSTGDAGGEPHATLVVPACEGLSGTSIGGAEIPALIDEVPMLSCVAAYADGETRIVDAAELRVKESDRIATIVSNLRLIGVDADELPDGLVVQGMRRRSPLRGHIVTHGDHRIAMAFGVLGSLPGNALTIDDPACTDVSYPGFWPALQTLAAAR
jgi:3-phosphoshikimate 1-carboxyvinyltransferase